MIIIPDIHGRDFWKESVLKSLIAEGRSDLRKMAKLKKYDETHHEIR